MPDNHTGLGTALVTLAGVTTVGNWEVTGISGLAESVAVLEATHLGSSGFMEKVPGPLKEPAQITISVYWNWGEALPAVGTAGDLDFTFPTGVSGLSTPGNYDGSGFLVSVSVGDLVAGTEKTAGTMVWQYDGVTGPTYTPSA